MLPLFCIIINDPERILLLRIICLQILFEKNWLQLFAIQRKCQCLGQFAEISYHARSG